MTAGIGALGATLALAPAGTPLAVLVVASRAVSGLGVGLAFPILSVQLLKISAPSEQGSNASALQLADALVTTAALASAGLLVAHVPSLTLGDSSGINSGITGVMALAAALAATAALCARRVFAVRLA